METSELLPTPEAQFDSSTRNKPFYERRKRIGKQIGISGVIALTSSQADSPASPSPKLDEEKERQMTATSGRKCYESYESFIRGGSSVKTLAASLLGTKAWFSNKCILTWKPKVTKSNRLLFQLFPSMRRTGETGSGLLPTHRAGNPGSRPNKKGGKILAEQIAMLPTPNARDTRGKSIKRDRVPDIVEGHNRPIGQQTGLKLQPAFVEWMMGYPEGWTEIPDSRLSEMRLSRKSQKK